MADAKPETAASTPRTPKLSALSRLRRAATTLEVAARLDPRVDHQVDAPLRVWFEWHRRNAPEVSLLPKGHTMCACIHPFPASDYEPRHLCARGRLQWRVFEARNRAVVTFFALLMFMYLPISTRILSFFLCQEIGDTWHLVVHRFTRCFSPVWWRYFPLATAGVFGFVVGVPLVSLTLVNMARTSHVEEYLHLVQQAEDDADPEEAAKRRKLLHPTQGKGDGKSATKKRCCHRYTAQGRREERQKQLDDMRKWQWERARASVMTSKHSTLTGAALHDKIAVGPCPCLGVALCRRRKRRTRRSPLGVVCRCCFHPQAECVKMSSQEFRKATQLAIEDERASGLSPTQDNGKLVSKYLYAVPHAFRHT